MSVDLKPARFRLDIFLIGGAIVLLIAIFFYVSGQSQQVLRHSPSGLDGLQRWLATDGHPVRSFTGGWASEPAKIGLRILPIYDSDLNTVRAAPTSKEELLAQMDEYDVSESLLRQKAQIVQTLLVLPKWRSGMRLTGLGHPALLIPEGRASTGLQQVLDGPKQNVRYLRQPFTDFPVTTNGQSRTARLYVAQVFDGAGCTPLIGRVSEMVLGRCKLPDAPNDEVLVLSDPDLLNNHGLRLGDNAHIVKDILLDLAGEKTVMIDYSTSIWLFENFQGETRERTWSDLARFFAYPFSVLWGSAALLMVLTLWRAGLRFGPVTQAARGLGASKQTANTARARLMRLTGQDGALLGDYAKTRLVAFAARSLPAAQSKDVDAALGYARRRNPKLARKLEDALAVIGALPPHLPASSAIEHVDRFELILEQLEHDT